MTDYAAPSQQLDWQLLSGIDTNALPPGDATAATLCAALATIAHGELPFDTRAAAVLDADRAQLAPTHARQPGMTTPDASAASFSMSSEAVAVHSLAQLTRVAQACLQLLCFSRELRASAAQALAGQIAEGRATITEAHEGLAQVRVVAEFTQLPITTAGASLRSVSGNYQHPLHICDDH